MQTQYAKELRKHLIPDLASLVEVMSVDWGDFTEGDFKHMSKLQMGYLQDSLYKIIKTNVI